MQSITATRKEVAPLITATFPDYRGRKFRIEPRAQVTLSDLNWDGGTRNQYRSCTTDGRKVGDTDTWNQIAPSLNAAEGATMTLPQGCVLVCRSMFCGKDAGLTLYVHPDDMPKWLK